MLLHGSNSSLHTWEQWVKELSDRFSILTIDLPGHGLTGPVANDDYSYEGMAEGLHKVLSRLGHRRFFLGGNSMGGGVTLSYTLTHPEMVEGMLLLDSSGVPFAGADKKQDLPLAFQLAGRWYTDWILRNITPRSLAAEGLKKSVTNQDIVTEKAIDRYWELARFPGNRRATGLRFASYRETGGLSLPVEEISAPALIIWGRDDNLIPVETVDVLKARLPDSEAIILDDTGHLPMEERPQESAAAARAFMEAIVAKQSK